MVTGFSNTVENTNTVGNSVTGFLKLLKYSVVVLSFVVIDL